jgi:hypothetical protein
MRTVAKTGEHHLEKVKRRKKLIAMWMDAINEDPTIYEDLTVQSEYPGYPEDHWIYTLDDDMRKILFEAFLKFWRYREFRDAREKFRNMRGLARVYQNTRTWRQRVIDTLYPRSSPTRYAARVTLEEIIDN